MDEDFDRIDLIALAAIDQAKRQDNSENLVADLLGLINTYNFGTGTSLIALLYTALAVAELNPEIGDDAPEVMARIAEIMLDHTRQLERATSAAEEMSRMTRDSSHRAGGAEENTPDRPQRADDDGSS